MLDMIKSFKRHIMTDNELPRTFDRVIDSWVTSNAVWFQKYTELVFNALLQAEQIAVQSGRS